MLHFNVVDIHEQPSMAMTRSTGCLLTYFFDNLERYFDVKLLTMKHLPKQKLFDYIVISFLQFISLKNSINFDGYNSENKQDIQKILYIHTPSEE